MSDGEPFNDVHGSATSGTVPACRRLVFAGRSGRLRVVSGVLEQEEAKRQKRSALPVGEEPEVADAHEAAWQEVKKKAAQELIDVQGHEALAVAVCGITPAE